MKYLLFTLLIFSTVSMLAETQTITVKAQKQTINASIADDNTEKVLHLNTSKKPLPTDKLVVYNNNSKEFKDWKRSFTIFDEADAEVLTLETGVKEAYHEIPLKTVFAKLRKNHDYALYTIALPKDPAKAAVVRVRRILICTISVK